MSTQQFLNTKGIFDKRNNFHLIKKIFIRDNILQEEVSPQFLKHSSSFEKKDNPHSINNYQNLILF